MNKTGRYGLIVAIICIGLSGCGKDIEEVKTLSNIAMKQRKIVKKEKQNLFQ